MGKTFNTGYLQNLVTYDASGNIVLPANLTVNGNLLVATQSYVTTQINNLINGAPALLDTLDELAAALGDDANFASTVTTSIAGKQAQLNGTGFVKVTGTTVSYDNSTYLTTSSASSTYVPYSGALASVNLGVYSITANAINSAGSGSIAGQINLRSDAFFSLVNGYGSIASGTTNQFNLYQTTGAGVFRGAILSLNSITASATRTYTLPDATGTLALTSDIPSVAGSYLPLTGGTLTGTLSVTNNGQILIGTTTAPNPVAGVKFPMSLTSDAVTRIRIDSTQATPNSGVGLYANGVQKFSFAMFGTDSDFTIYNDALLSSAILVKGLTSNVLIGYGLATADTGFKLDVNGTGRFLTNSNGFVTRFTGGATSGVLGGFYANSTLGFASIGVQSNHEFRIFTNDADRLTIAASTGAATFSSSVTASGVRSINGGVDGTFQDAFVGVYNANNNEQNAIQTSVSSAANASGFRFQVSNGGGSSGRTNVVDFRRDRALFYTNVGIGPTTVDTILHVSGNAVNNVGLVKFHNLSSATSSYNPALSVLNDRGDHSYGTVAEFRITNTTDGDRPSILFSKGGTGNNWSIGMGVYGGSHDNFAIGYRNSYPAGVWATSYLTITTGGNVGIGTNPGYKLDVAGAAGVGDAFYLYYTASTINDARNGRIRAIASSDINPYAGGLAFDVYRYEAPSYQYFESVRLRADGNVGIGTINPYTKLDVNGNIRYSARVYSGNSVIGNISPNLNSAATRNYILVCDLNDIAGFSMSGFMNAASYTCWNISSFYIMKNYSSTSANAGITGQFKGGGCDMNIVDLNYGAGRYIAIGYTSNPEIDVIWTGYRLLHMLGADGSATVVPQSNVTVNSTLASY